MVKLQQFGLLMWKNFLLQRRKLLVTFFEIGIPTVASLILILIRQRVDSKTVDKPREWIPFPISAIPADLRPPSFGQWKIAYAPTMNFTETLMSRVGKDLNIMTKGQGYETEDDVVNIMMAGNQTSEDILAGIIFFNIDRNGFADKKNITYKLRFPSLPRQLNRNAKKFRFFGDKNWRTETMFPGFQRVGPREGSMFGKDPGYYEDGFLSLQHAIDNSIITQLNPSYSKADVFVSMRRFPYPPYIDDEFVVVIQQQLSFIIMVSFVFFALNIVKNVVHEKERKLKESMKMMGLSNWLHWLAWFTLYILMMAVTAGLVTLFLCVKTGEKGSVIEKSEPSVIFVFLILYAASTIGFCFAVSVFFKKAISGAAAGGILFFLSYLPYSIIQPRYATMTQLQKIFSCLISNVAMSLGGEVIGMFEGTGEGVQWKNIYQGSSVDDNFSMLLVMIMLVADTILYCVIAWYVEGVRPGEYGIPLPWYFPFSKTYWCGNKQLTEEEISETVPLLLDSANQKQSDFCEREPSGIRAGVKIRKLRKEFGSGATVNVAVKGMTLNIYEGQITALLGHNGAGKTTTMFMLTGFLPPTSGTAFVNGYDICKDIANVRSSLGLCPQHNVLFDNLTVEEHLVFFCKLKGFPRDKVKDEVDRMLQSIGLEEKRNALSMTLSGGMKRKLSVGIALIGDSKIVILDEPTSGMDPNARRHTWDLLQKHRAGRTMILTTHFMDEADLLGDRIAIMAEGVIKCCGSSLFLKKKYGAGYHMVIVKEEECNVNHITAIVKQHVPTAELESNIGRELSYILPHESSDKFEALFNELETNRKQLGIASYGASVTTMEEVFMKVGENSEMTLRDKLSGAQNGEPATFDYNSTDTGTGSDFNETAPMGQFSVGSVGATSVEYTEFDKTLDYNHGPALYAQQFRAMFVKRVLHTMRNKILTLSQLAVPFVFLIIALAVVKTLPVPGDLPPLALNLSKFDENTVIYGTEKEATPRSTHLAECYKSQFNDTDSKTIFLNKVPDYKIDPDLEKYLIFQGKESISRYNSHYIVAAMFHNSTALTTSAMAYFNNQAYHSPGVALNVLQNAILRFFTTRNATITTVNHPLPRSIKERVDDETATLMIGFSVSFNVLFGMAFLASSFVMFLIKERATKVKHCQFISGVHSLTFWSSTFCWDFINFMIPVVVLLIVFAAFGIEGYVESDRLPLILMMLVLYGWAMLPFMYLLSYLFTVPSTGLVWLSIFNIFSGVVTVLAVQILNIPNLGTKDISKALEWVCLVLIPNFGLGDGLNTFYSSYQFMKICTMPEIQFLCDLNVTTPCCKDNCGENCLDYQSNYLSFEPGGIGRMVLFLAIQGFVFIAILFLVETSIFHRVTSDIQSKAVSYRVMSMGRQSSQSQVEEDSDVTQEKYRIANTNLGILLNSDSLILQDLFKYYGDFLAVNGISVGIPQGECFGLLGINGAGKTTTFKMLTGDENVSQGNAYLNGYSIRDDIQQVQQSVGYCPQFDALIDQMTGREMLFMYARLRGVKECLITFVVDRLINSLMLTHHADKMVGSYSGGNKRKLSTAIALVGEPPVIFLDEPTTGMDPVARRFLWDALSHYRARGKTLVLTSHSMEECEALCTRIAIMVNGEFRCLGSPQHLKNKFGEGYTLMAKVAFPEQGEPDLGPLKAFVEETFPRSHLKDVHQGLVHYHITDTTLSWAKIFGNLERAKSRLHIEDYSVSQTTLEQVFINFARAQIPPREDENTGCCQRCRTVFCFCCPSSTCCRSTDSGILD